VCAFLSRSWKENKSNLKITESERTINHENLKKIEARNMAHA
jgi:hypothetical protein